MADPDFELRWGPGFGLLALPAFLPSVISSFFTQNMRGPSPRSTAVYRRTGDSVYIWESWNGNILAASTIIMIIELVGMTILPFGD